MSDGFDKVVDRLPAPKVKRKMTAVKLTPRFGMGGSEFLTCIKCGALLPRVLSAITVPVTSARRG